MFLEVVLSSSQTERWCQLGTQFPGLKPVLLLLKHKELFPNQALGLIEPENCLGGKGAADAVSITSLTDINFHKRTLLQLQLYIQWKEKVNNKLCCSRSHFDKVL